MSPNAATHLVGAPEFVEANCTDEKKESAEYTTIVMEEDDLDCMAEISLRAEKTFKDVEAAEGSEHYAESEKNDCCDRMKRSSWMIVWYALNTVWAIYCAYIAVHFIEYVLWMFKLMGFDFWELPKPIMIGTLLVAFLLCAIFLWYFYRVLVRPFATTRHCAGCPQGRPNSDCPVNPTPIRKVHLKARSDGYGFIVRGNAVKEILADGAAKAQGGLKHGDEILAVNGVNTETLSHPKIVALVRERADSVDLHVRYNPERLKQFA